MFPGLSHDAGLVGGRASIEARKGDCDSHPRSLARPSAAAESNRFYAIPIHKISVGVFPPRHSITFQRTLKLFSFNLCTHIPTKIRKILLASQQNAQFRLPHYLKTIGIGFVDYFKYFFFASNSVFSRYLYRS